MTTVTYNGQNLPQPLPLISKSEGIQFVGERFSIRDTYTLQGSLIGCDGLSALLTSGTALLNLFNKNFQDFVVQENGADVIRASGTIVESIRFGDSDYAGSVPYTVTLACYPAAIQNTFGVVDPVDQWNFDEGQDGVVAINHNVSARAYGAFQNAVSFVQVRTGAANAPSVQFLSLTGLYQLSAQQESLDRFNGVYSVNETYSMDTRNSGLLTRYTFDMQSGLEGFIQAGLNGTVEGGLLSSIGDVRSRYAGFNWRQIGQNLYSQATDLTDLNTTPLSSGVVEDTFNKRLNFTLAFDNNPDPVVSLDRTVTIASGDETTQVNVNGRIYGRGEQNARWAQIQNYYNGVNILGMAQSGYNYYGGTYTLNRKPVSSGVTINPFGSEITFDVEFNDRDPAPQGFQSFNAQLNVTPAIRRIVPRQIAAYENRDESFYFVDMGFYPKVRLSINGNGILDENVPVEIGRQLVIDEVERLFYQYNLGQAQLETKEVTFSPDFGRGVSFNFAWVADALLHANNEPRFDVVSTLAIR